MEREPNIPWQSYDPPGSAMSPSPTPFPTGKRELVFCALILLSGMALCNFVLFGGFNLGFALAAIACIACTFVYLLLSGCAPTAYSAGLLGLSTVIVTAFIRSDDAFVKFVMLCFLAVSINLSFCIMAQQNLRRPGSAASLLDAPRAILRLGIGHIPHAFLGLGQAFHRSGTVGQKGGAFLLGLCIAVPILAIVIPLLIRADAAFDGLVSLLPELDFQELFATIFFGSLLACLLYLRGVALKHAPKESSRKKSRRGLSSITVNTFLGAVCLIYFVYLASQLAYLIGGFAGILPEQYTLAQYARRGFFEMAVLCGVNLGVIVLSLGTLRKDGRAPLATRLLCLFLGFVTLFLIATASAKMFLYIGSYGLTRLRVLTQIIMLFLAVTTAVVMVWLFTPRLPYMKVILLAALVIGAATLWTDVDTQVAHHNVDAYLSGQLDSVDVGYLSRLGSGAVPQLAQLAQQIPDDLTAELARNYLKEKANRTGSEDIRSWNYVNQAAERILSAYRDPD